MPNELTTRIPFAFARSALFRPAEHRGETFNCTEIPSASDYPISLHYTGPELTLSHSVAWQALVALAYKHNKGTTPALTIRLIDILRAMGRNSVQTHAKRWVRSLVDDLSHATVLTSTPRHLFNGPLLARVESAGAGKITVDFAAGMDAFLFDEVVKISMGAKQTVAAYPLAQWLHDYVASHRSTYEVPIETLQRLTDTHLSTATFRSRITKALSRLQSAGLVQSYSLSERSLKFTKAKTAVVLLPKKTGQTFRGRPRHDVASVMASGLRTRVPL